MKMYEIITPEMFELMSVWENKLNRVVFDDNQLYLYGKDEVLEQILNSDECSDIKEEVINFQSFSRGWDNYLGSYLIFS